MRVNGVEESISYATCGDNHTFMFSDDGEITVDGEVVEQDEGPADDDEDQEEADEEDEQVDETGICECLDTHNQAVTFPADGGEPYISV